MNPGWQTLHAKERQADLAKTIGALGSRPLADWRQV